MTSLASGKFGVILADPPYRHRNVIPFRESLHPAANYKTMSAEDIGAIPVSSWAADPAVLVLWASPPMVDVAVDLGRAWGFSFVTAIPWMKTFPNGAPRRGAGTWFMQCWEMVLVFKRSSPGVLRDGALGLLGLLLGEPKGLFAVPPKRHHSAKPYDVHAYLETFPGPYLELFATEDHPGWICWGLDTGFRLSERGVEATGVLPVRRFPLLDPDPA